MGRMTLFLALLTLCLGLFFLSVFFQLAKMEKRMQKQVTLLEKYMSQRYNLENTAVTAAQEEE